MDLISRSRRSPILILIKWIDFSQDKDGRLYDSRAGLGSYYRYGPRKVYDLCNDKSVGVSVPVPKIHQSVFDRIDSGCNAYADRAPARLRHRGL